MSDKPTNPKEAIGVLKLPLHLVSGVVKAYIAVAFHLGATKYGAWNFRPGGARASVYLSALGRHIDRWTEGDENDPVDGTPHLANALACIAIIIEAKEGGNLVDDRPPSRPLGATYERLEAMMKVINETYKDRNPRHYTIADTEKPNGVMPVNLSKLTPHIDTEEGVPYWAKLGLVRCPSNCNCLEGHAFVSRSYKHSPSCPAHNNGEVRKKNFTCDDCGYSNDFTNMHDCTKNATIPLYKCPMCGSNDKHRHSRTCIQSAI